MTRRDGQSKKFMATSLERLLSKARALGCPADQIENFLSVGYVPQPKQLEFHAAARSADGGNGPDQVGFGGARGPGKSHASFAQLALDDCRRQPGLKGLYLRKVGKQAREQFDDLRRSVLVDVPHGYNRQAGIVSLWDDARIFIGHFKSEGDIDNYLGIEYDVILIEEATTLSESKYRALRDSNRTSKPTWRPRVYLTTNPGNIGHVWFKQRFVEPYQLGEELFTRFVPATVDDNRLVDVGYKRKLEENSGWKLRAYRYGDWDIAAGQYFSTFDRTLHVIEPFPIPSAWWSWLAMDYGFVHPTVFVLLTMDGDGNVYVVDEHVQSRWLPERHAEGVRAMLARHAVGDSVLSRIPAGTDVFAKTSERTIADQYAALGLRLVPADTDRINGAAEIARRLGDIDHGIDPSLYIFNRCARLIECLPAMQHDQHRPEDVLKWDVDEDGKGGDDPYDCLRYGLMTDRVRSARQTPIVIRGVDPLAQMDRGRF
jgi:phage terminase large subunit